LIEEKRSFWALEWRKEAFLPNAMCGFWNYESMDTYRS